MKGVLDKYDNETIDKILAGYMDSDGSVGVYNKGKSVQLKSVQLKSSLGQAASNDPDFEIVRAFQSHYRVGSLQYYIPAGDNRSSAIQWVLGVKDTKALFSRIGKHMMVDARRFEYYIDIFDKNRGSEVDLEDIRAKVPYGPLEPKGYPDYAWLAGYVAGDGHLRCQLTTDGCRANELNLQIKCKQREVLDYLKMHFGGNVRKPYKDKSYIWERALGTNSSTFAIPFLENLTPYMIHERKRKTIEKMLKFLKRCK